MTCRLPSRFRISSRSSCGVTAGRACSATTGRCCRTTPRPTARRPLSGRSRTRFPVMPVSRAAGSKAVRPRWPPAGRTTRPRRRPRPTASLTTPNLSLHQAGRGKNPPPAPRQRIRAEIRLSLCGKNRKPVCKTLTATPARQSSPRIGSNRRPSAQSMAFHSWSRQRRSAASQGLPPSCLRQYSVRNPASEPPSITSAARPEEHGGRAEVLALGHVPFLPGLLSAVRGRVQRFFAGVVGHGVDQRSGRLRLRSSPHDSH